VPTAPVVIEDDVWIGPGCMVLKGVRVGAGSFVEPGSVLTAEVPPRSRVSGNPAKIIGTV
jgi:acetyltransferase-like isoleucine patch superfamily enzyme